VAGIDIIFMFQLVAPDELGRATCRQGPDDRMGVGIVVVADLR
jgi:hypothetical protein